MNIKKIFGGQENQDKNSQEYLQAKYRIKKVNNYFEVEYFDRIGINGKNTERVKAELAIAFGCEVSEIAVNLSETDQNTKFLYVFDEERRFILALESDNLDIQIQLALENNREINKALALNQNLSDEAAIILVDNLGKSLISTSLQPQIRINEKFIFTENVKAIWSIPYANAQVLAKLIKMGSLKVEDFWQDGNFTQGVSSNLQITPEFLAELASQDPTDNVNSFLIRHPKTPSEILTKIQSDLKSIEPKDVSILNYSNTSNSKFGIVIEHPNTTTQDLDDLWEYMKSINCNNYYNVHFSKNHNTSSKVLDEIFIDGQLPIVLLNLVKHPNYAVDKKIEVLNLLLENHGIETPDFDFDFKDNSEIVFKNQVQKTIFDDIASDLNTPPEILKVILDYLNTFISGSQKNPEPSRLSVADVAKELIAEIIAKNPNLKINLPGDVNYENQQDLNIEEKVVKRGYNSIVKAMPKIAKNPNSSDSKLLNLLYNLSSDNSEILPSRLAPAIYEEVATKRGLSENLLFEILSYINECPSRGVDKQSVFNIKKALVGNKNLPALRSEFGARFVKNFYEEIIAKGRPEFNGQFNNQELFSALLSIASNPYSPSSCFGLLYDLSKNVPKNTDSKIEFEIEKALINNPGLPDYLLLQIGKTSGLVKDVIKNPSLSFDSLYQIYKEVKATEVRDMIVEKFTTGEIVEQKRSWDEPADEETKQYIDPSQTDFWQNQAYKVPWEIQKEILSSRDSKVVDLYIYRHKQAFLKNPENTDIINIFGPVGSNYKEIIGIENHLQTASEVVKMVENYPEYEGKGEIVVHNPEIQATPRDLLSYNNPNSLIILISQIQQYFLEKNKDKFSFLKQDLLAGKERKLLEAFSEIAITLDNNNLKFEIETDQEYGMEKYGLLMNNAISNSSIKPFTYRFEIDITKSAQDLSTQLSWFTDSLKELFIKVEKEAKKEQEKQQQLFEQQTYEDVLKRYQEVDTQLRAQEAELDKFTSEERDKALQELEAKEKEHELELQFLLEKLIENSAAAISEEDAKKFHKELVENSTLNKITKNIDTVLGEINFQTVKDNEYKLQFLNMLELIAEQSSNTKKKKLLHRELSKTFAENHFLNPAIYQNSKSDPETDSDNKIEKKNPEKPQETEKDSVKLNLETIQALNDFNISMGKIQSKFNSVTNEHKLNFKDDSDLPKEWLYGGLDKNNRKTIGLIDLLDLRKKFYIAFLKQKGVVVPEKIKNHLMQDLFKLEKFLSILKS